MTAMTKETLAVIEGPHFYAGIVLREGHVIEAADIVRYMKRWSRDRVREYCRAKGWKISVVSESEVNLRPATR